MPANPVQHGICRMMFKPVVDELERKLFEQDPHNRVGFKETHEPIENLISTRPAFLAVVAVIKFALVVFHFIDSFAHADTNRERSVLFWKTIVALDHTPSTDHATGTPRLPANAPK